MGGGYGSTDRLIETGSSEAEGERNVNDGQSMMCLEDALRARGALKNADGKKSESKARRFVRKVSGLVKK